MAPTRSSTKAARRRQRSTRITVAVALLGVAGLLVVLGLLGPLSWLAPVSAVLAVLLGAAATRITYAELVQSRVDAAADRAGLAQDYRWMFENRMREHRLEATGLRQVQQDTEKRAAVLEQAVVETERRVTKASRALTVATRRADDAEARAAEAIVRLAEMEHEADALRAELEVWRSTESRRRHA